MVLGGWGVDGVDGVEGVEVIMGVESVVGLGMMGDCVCWWSIAIFLLQ